MKTMTKFTFRWYKRSKFTVSHFCQYGFWWHHSDMHFSFSSDFLSNQMLSRIWRLWSCCDINWKLLAILKRGGAARLPGNYVNTLNKAACFKALQWAFKGIVHPKMKIISVITLPHVVPTP